MSKPVKPPSLWRWILLRVLSLAIGCVIIIAGCMWVGYRLMNIWVLHTMPEATRQEMRRLFTDPDIDILRYHQLVDTWYGVNFSNPYVVTIDWILLCILVLVAIPTIVILGLYAARPLSRQFTHLAVTAKAVSEGVFTQRVGLEKMPRQNLLS